MTCLQYALDLAAVGFHVFPIIPNSKLPAIDDFPGLASRDPETIKKWWLDPVLGIEQPFNIGVSTTRFGEKHALLVVDVDNKGKKKGSDELIRLEIQGCEFPPTFTQTTPTGGKHLVYVCDEPVKQGANVFAEGLDVRSRGGYIVGCGSVVEGGTYRTEGIFDGIAPAPAWMVAQCGRPTERTAFPGAEVQGINQERAVSRAYFYLTTEAPLALEGAAGDQTTYVVACRVKDFGVSKELCLKLLLEHWNERCSPPWEPSELKDKVENAYRYGALAQGAAAPEAAFKPLEPVKEEQKLHPFQELNREFAFVVAGGGSHILWETTDQRDGYKLEHLAVQAFHQKLAARTLMMGDGKIRPVSELWMRSPDRRSYDGICFEPGRECSPRFYNLWRGFAVEPAEAGEAGSKEARESLDMFIDHARKNVCKGDEGLFRWLMAYFAHIVQKPWEKPLVAMVFRGGKGVGKNALIDRVGHLLGNHYLLTSNRRYLIGNFNGHLENCLLFALDEAFWSGDKQAEGTLKDLITGKAHVIEHKGKEPYTVENCTRVCIIGNEEWLVPASQDERRFAVFDVGDGRKQDRSYFQRMREGMESGGYRLLLRFLLNFDISGIDINDAPRTSALLDQKVSSLDPFHQWWLDCLHEGKLIGSDFGGAWQKEVDKERFRSAFRRYVRERNIRSRIPEDRGIGRYLKSCLPSIDGSGKRREGDELINTYRVPTLEQARKEWEKYIGHTVAWE